jgi:proline dehydrogenase
MFTLLSRSATLKHLASRYGMAPERGFARRFIAGEDMEEAVEAARRIEARGFRLTLDYLGEAVTTVRQAVEAARQYVRLMDLVVASGIERNISVKLSQLGLAIDRATSVDNMRRILEPAERHGFFVRIDMEGSAYTESTMAVFDTLWRLEHRNVGIVLQSALYRTEQDLRRMNELGVRVRLVKGAYREPASIAHQQRADVDAAYLRQMRLLLDHGTYPAFATHDEAVLTEVRSYAAERGIARDRFEFQMLYGVRRDLQTAFVADGYRVRVYVPFGEEWFPYFMRRLGERPANVWFVVSALLGERKTP